MAAMWKEVEQVKEEKRCELVLSGPPYSKRIEENGLDPGIFTIKHLNFLEISKTNLSELPPDIGELANLTRMIICYNNLTSLPKEMAKLKKLKFLDISHNAIVELPAEISQLSDLQALNASSNKLSFLPDVGEMVKLVTLNISYNQFASLPGSLYNSKLIHFTDLIANNNEISEIPADIEILTSLKVLDLGENKIITIPGELGNCSKLKELNLKGNKLKDKRLLKLVDQCHVKQIMDYIRNHCPKTNTDNKQNKSKKKGKQGKKTDIEEVSDLLIVFVSVKNVLQLKGIKTF